jgi:hypothetical protein
VFTPTAAHDRTVLGKAGQRSDGVNARMEDAMYPGLSDTDCQVAAFRFRQLVAEGQHRQFVAGLCTGPADIRSGTTTFPQRLGTLLVRAGYHLQGLNTVTKQSLDTLATGERAAIA